MPCYRCGTRQVDPEPGKSSPWHRGVVREHQVLICPDCYPVAAGDLTRCSRCDSIRLMRRLDQVECLNCRLTRDAETDVDADAEVDVGPETGADPAVPPPRAKSPADSGLSAEVAQALARLLGSE